MYKTAEQKAQLIAEDMMKREGVSGPVAFDPLTILTIVSVIVQIVRFFQRCGLTPLQGADRLNNPSWLDRMIFNRITKKTLRRMDREYLLGPVRSSMMRNSGAFNELAMIKIYREVNDAKRSKLL